MIRPLWKIVWRVLKKLKIKLLYIPSISFWGIYPKELKIGSQRDICTLTFIAALFTIGKYWEDQNVHQWIIKKTWYVHTTGYHSALKEGNPDICCKHAWTWRTLCWLKPITKTNTAWFHWHEVSNLVRLTEIDMRMVYQGPGGGTRGALFSGCSISVMQDGGGARGWFCDLFHNNTHMVSNIVLYSWKLLGRWILYYEFFCHSKKKVLGKQTWWQKSTLDYI